ncbi:MAG: aminotransferase class III-fold pyridoxal phosphate-dependent enzyme [Planctomycetota bacterium]
MQIPTSSALSQVWSRIHPVPIVRGEGSYVFDSGGNRLLDFTSGIAVTSTGHCHPRVVEAISAQASQLIFGQMNCMLPDIVSRYAEQLRSRTPDSIESFFFSNSGAEAVEGAIKLAKVATQRTNVIAFDGGFHGRTALTMALTSSKGIYRSGYQPLPSGVFFSPFPACFRYGWDEEQTVDFCMEQLRHLLKARTTAAETACIIVEPVLGEGGFIPAPTSFIEHLREICDETGILLILDEVQSGFGRTGNMWAHEPSGVQPDILVLAKGIASGMPLSAIGASDHLMEKWPPGSHGGTYGGGNAISMAAALATLEVIEEEDLVHNARVQGDYLKHQLTEILEPLPDTDIRGPGLMIGVELTHNGKPNARLTSQLQQACHDADLMLLTCGTDSNVLRWLPPLTVSRDEINEGLSIFEASLRKVALQ